jgi:catechol 2,3-dioxygenase-like lactoylglutathione lyase family enzyme
MITSGNATIYITDMNRAVQFYTETLGLKLKFRAGDGWAEMETSGLNIGLHQVHPHGPEAGKSGSISVGFGVDQPLEEIVSTLESRGVTFRGPILDGEGVRLAFFGDPDGNDLYLAEPKHG